MRKRFIILLIFSFVWPLASIANGPGKTPTATPALAPEPENEEISITNSEGIILNGILVPPQKNKPTLVLLHMLARTKETYNPLVGKLKDRGYGVFYYDARGHGQSTATAQGATINFTSFSRKGKDNEWNRMVKDLGEVIDYLSKDKGIKKDNLALVGASIGANVVLNYFVDHAEIKAAVLLSPGLNYHDVDTEAAAKRYVKASRPLLIVAAQGDIYSYNSCQTLLKELQAGKTWPVKFVALSGKAHGTNMLGGELDDQLLDWLDQNLKPLSKK